MKKKLVFAIVLLTLVPVLCSCGVASKEDVAVVSLSSGALMGELPSTVASESGNQDQAPCLLVGTFSPTATGTYSLYFQMYPDTESSGVGDLYSELELPAVYNTDLHSDVLCGALLTLSADGVQTVDAAFPLIDLGLTEGLVNQQLTEDREGEFVYPVVICTDGGEYYLRSMTDGAAFIPASPLPQELTGKAIDAADLEPEVYISHCGIARFSVVASYGERSHSLLIELKSFLYL